MIQSLQSKREMLAQRLMGCDYVYLVLMGCDYVYLEAVLTELGLNRKTDLIARILEAPIEKLDELAASFDEDYEPTSYLESRNPDAGSAQAETPAGSGQPEQVAGERTQ